MTQINLFTKLKQTNRHRKPTSGYERGKNGEVDQEFGINTDTQLYIDMGFPGGSDGKESACTVGDLGSLGWEDPLEEGMASHSSTLAWKIPWTEKPGRLQSMESQRFGHD